MANSIKSSLRKHCSQLRDMAELMRGTAAAAEAINSTLYEAGDARAIPPTDAEAALRSIDELRGALWDYLRKLQTFHDLIWATLPADGAKE